MDEDHQNDLQFKALQSDIVQTLFMDTADDNYIIARWCYQNKMFREFFWNGAHAVEKYLKAVLLLNGHTAINYGHDVGKLYNAVLNFSSELLPTMMIKPNGSFGNIWHSESVESFIHRLATNGDPNNRYDIFGHTMHIGDIYRLDRLVFAIRRLCCRLDDWLFGSIEEGLPQITKREFLKSNQSQDLSSPSQKIQKVMQGTEEHFQSLRRIFLQDNILFAPNGFEHGSSSHSMAGTNSVLWRRFFARPLEPKDRTLLLWLLDNVNLPPNVRKQLKDQSKI